MVVQHSFSPLKRLPMVSTVVFGWQIKSQWHIITQAAKAGHWQGVWQHLLPLLATAIDQLDAVQGNHPIGIRAALAARPEADL
jgi:hypothetical protein